LKIARIIFAALVGLVALGYFLLLLLFPTYSHRYRLGIDVDVAGETRSGSSVIEVRWHLFPESLRCLFGCNIGYSRVYGQAVLIDMGPQGALLATLWPANTTSSGQAVPADFLALRAFGSQPLPSTGYSLSPETPDSIREMFRMSNARGKAILSANNMPQFIWLKDANDPASAKPILAKDFPSVFDGNVRLRAASIEITTDPIATGLEQKLPWLKAMREEQLKRGISTVPGKFFLATDPLLGSPS
jgi:hypothetical protein